MAEQHKGPDSPFTLEELALRDDLPAEQKVPDDVRAGLASNRVTVTVPPGQQLAPSTGGTLTLPEGSFYGCAVKETRLHERGSLRAPDGPQQAARPMWQPYLHHPRPAPVRRLEMRRIKGGTVTPFAGPVYGEYPPRQVFYPRGYPWVCIGRIFVWRDISAPNWDYSGTGVLAGARTVLTASHVVPWGSTHWGAKFVAGYYDGASTAGPGGWSWVTDAHGYGPQNVSAHDMAVFRLDTPLGNQLGWFGTKGWDSSWEGRNYWTLVGYPGAVSPERPSYQAAIHVIDTDTDSDARELEHHADAGPGDSGGPFFGQWSDGAYAIGTLSGYEVIHGPLGIGSEDNNISAGGNALGALVKFGRDNWP